MKRTYNENYIALLSYLLKQQHLPKTSAIIDYLNIPTRMVYALLQQTNKALRSKHIPPIISDGTPLMNSQSRYLIQELKRLNANDFVSPEMRQVLINICLILPFKKWTVEKLQSVFKVSRNTILRDISNLKKTNNIEFRPQANKAKGFYMTPSTWLSRLNFLMTNITKIQSGHDFSNILLEATNLNFDPSEFKVAGSNLQLLYKQELGKKISYADAVRLTYFTVIVSAYRFQHDDYRTIFSQTDIKNFNQRRETIVATNFIKTIQERFNIDPDKQVLYYTVLLLLSITKQKDDHYASHSFADLLHLSESIVTHFLDVSDFKQVVTEDKDSLVEAIQTQIKTFWYDSRYNTINSATGLYYNKKSVRLTENILINKVDQHLYQNIFPFGLNRRSIIILSMILYSFSIRQPKVLFSADILIVSNLPPFTTDLLSSVIIKTLPTAQVKMTDLVNYDATDSKKYNLIITDTADISTHEAPIFLINDVLTDTDLNRLGKIITAISTNQS